MKRKCDRVKERRRETDKAGTVGAMKKYADREERQGKNKRERERQEGEREREREGERGSEERERENVGGRR